MNGLLGAVGNHVVDRIQGAKRFAGDVFSGNAADDAVADAIINVPSMYTLPIKAAEKITGVPIKEGFKDGVVSEVGDPRSGQYEIRIPPMPF